MNVLPLPWPLSQVMLPPWPSTIILVMDRPSPAPAMAAFRADSVRKKRLKTLAVSSRLIPIPVSLTLSRTHSSLKLALTLTVPPSGEYLMALETRLSSAWPIRSGSA